jgi:thiamine pyrophosphate-dependent acetolactate synthase large subunit-like protein
MVSMIERPDEIAPAIRWGLESGRPMLVDVVCDPEVIFPAR